MHRIPSKGENIKSIEYFESWMNVRRKKIPGEKVKRLDKYGINLTDGHNWHSLSLFFWHFFHFLFLLLIPFESSWRPRNCKTSMDKALMIPIPVSRSHIDDDSLWKWISCFCQEKQLAAWKCFAFSFFPRHSDKKKRSLIASLGMQVMRKSGLLFDRKNNLSCVFLCISAWTVILITLLVSLTDNSPLSQNILSINVLFL
jgi:hypothetical protein